MNTLIIDDLRILSARPSTYIRTYNAAIEYLSNLKEPLDELWLDHDLGEEKTGYDVALFIEEKVYCGNKLPIKQIYIHSQNPIGVRKIEQALSKHYSVQIISLKSFTTIDNNQLL